MEIAGREVVITNPDKVFFPRAGYTKLDLAKYYAAVAEGVAEGGHVQHDVEAGTDHEDGNDRRCHAHDGGDAAYPGAAGGSGVHGLLIVAER